MMVLVCEHHEEAPVSTVPVLEAHYTPEDYALVQRMIEKLRRGEDSRQERIASLRAAVACGQLDKPLRMEIAMDRLIDDVAA